MELRSGRPRRIVAIAMGLVLLAGCGGGGGKSTQPPEDDGQLPLETYDAGFFSIRKPKGWTVTTAGSCTLFAFLVQDPQDPLRQIFYFGTVGPVYTRQAQKDLDQWYVDHGGFDIITWLDAPVIDPLTVENYVAHWPDIASMEAATRFMARFPDLQDLHLVATSPQAAMLPGGATANARGLFTHDARIGEGMFLATVKEYMPYTGVPGGGTAYGNFVCGVTAPKGEFADVVDRLIESLNTFTVTQAYVDGCFAQQQQAWGAVAEAGRTLSEASDIIFDGWQERTHGQDISAEQWTDAYRGVERVYDPTTGEVYEFPAGWFEQYDPNRGQYDMSGLQPLPGDSYDLWMQAVLDGLSHFH
jgi:hypothetical protein